MWDVVSKGAEQERDILWQSYLSSRLQKNNTVGGHERRVYPRTVETEGRSSMLFFPNNRPFS